jgi:hypothetical protein
MRNKMSALIAGLTSSGLVALTGCEAGMHRVGQTATVQFGVVRNVERVTLESAAAQGALIGGTLGLITGRRGSSSAGNAIKGAAIGGVATAASEGNRHGTSYTVEMLDGSSTRIVTDQHEIRTGDCVAVERSGNNANIRRTSAAYCDPANRQAVEAVEPSTRSEAMRCQSAKDELANAKSDEAADLASRKVDLLCDD